MRRFACLAAMLFVGVLAFGASTASAETIRWFSGASNGCQDGTATVAPGPTQVTFGWGTYAQRYTQDFLNVQYITYSVNGGAPVVTGVGDRTGWVGKPGKDPNGVKLYVAAWTSPTLATLASGESITVTFSLKTTETVYDNATTPYPAGMELLGAYTTCTITAA